MNWQRDHSGHAQQALPTTQKGHSMNRYYRSNTDKIIAGVCGGLAQTLHISPLLLRIVFVVAALFNGVGLVAYVMLWLFMAPESSTFATTDELVRHNAEEMRERAKDLGMEAQRTLSGDKTSQGSNNKRLVLGVVLAGLGVLALFRSLGLLAWVGRLWPLGLIALGAVLLLNHLKDK
jgi:phage shock protein PspC (stress-responsive transcriptional regulator)